MRIPELLVPASSLEVLQVAVIFGADAVYIGGEAFGLRAKAKNFSKEDMSEGQISFFKISQENHFRLQRYAEFFLHCFFDFLN